jgi:hypothetical protein
MPNGTIAGVLPGLAQLNVDRTAVLAGLRNYFIGVYAEHAVAQGKTHWGAKSAVDVFYLEQIEQLMTGHAKFVLILRHGLDVAASLVELSEKVGGYFRELHRYVSQYQYPAEAFVRMWSDLTSALLDFSERHRSQVCLIRYEDLVHDAEATINGVFRFVGISEQFGLVDRALRERDDGLGDWKASQFKSVSTHGVGRWKRLNPPLISTLARIANPVLLRCGYAEVPVRDVIGESDDHARYAGAVQLSRLVPRGTPDAP